MRKVGTTAKLYSVAFLRARIFVLVESLFD